LRKEEKRGLPRASEKSRKGTKRGGFREVFSEKRRIRRQERVSQIPDLGQKEEKRAENVEKRRKVRF